MIDVLATDSQKLLHQLNVLLDQESRCQPKVCGLKLLEFARDGGLGMSARLGGCKEKDLGNLTQFFRFDVKTFSLDRFLSKMNLLDRFLSKMKVRLKHLGCVGYSSFYLAVNSVEKERNVLLVADFRLDEKGNYVQEVVLESQSCYCLSISTTVSLIQEATAI